MSTVTIITIRKAKNGYIAHNWNSDEDYIGSTVKEALDYIVNDHLDKYESISIVIQIESHNKLK